MKKESTKFYKVRDIEKSVGRHPFKEEFKKTKL
jgi:hypothetical protein